jgi:hypothetical protein
MHRHKGKILYLNEKNGTFVFSTSPKEFVSHVYYGRYAADNEN